MSEALLNQAAFALQRGDLWRAEYCYREVITRDPGNFEALDALAAVLAQRGRAEDAATLYEQALRLKPGDAIALSNYGGVLEALGRLGHREAGVSAPSNSSGAMPRPG